MERILEAQGAFVCLPLGDKADKAVLADRSVGLGTWLAVTLAVGVVLLVLLCLARVVWQSYCLVLSPPFFYLFPLRLLGGLGGSGGSNAGDQDQNLTAVSVVQPSGGTVLHRTAFRGPTGPLTLFVPQPMGRDRSIGDILVNPNYDPDCYDSDSIMYAGVAAARTSTPLQAGCSKGSTQSLVSDAWSRTPQHAGCSEGSIGWISLQDVVSEAGSFKSVANPDAQGAVGGAEAAVGGAESTRVGDPLLLYHQEHGVIVDRASLGDNLMESGLSGLVEAVLDTFTQPLAAEVLDTSTQPLVAEAAPTRPRLPRKAKTKSRDGQYRDPDDPYRRFSK